MLNNIAEVAKHIKSLFVKWNEYTSFSYTCGNNSRDGKFYERWGLYTETLGHNSFKNNADLINFIKKMLKDEDNLYKNYKRLELLSDKARYEDLLANVIKEIETLDITINKEE